MKNFLKVVVGMVCILIATVSNAASMSDVSAALRSQNIPLAYKLAKPLADKGDPDAQYLVASLLYNGKGVSQDYVSAVSYYKKCAGNPKADKETKADCFWILSIAYSEGFVENKDKMIAVKLLASAARLGHQKAYETLSDIVCKTKDQACLNNLDEQLAN
jgi:hypothetical protein